MAIIDGNIFVLERCVTVYYQPKTGDYIATRAKTVAAIDFDRVGIGSTPWDAVEDLYELELK